MRQRFDVPFELKGLDESTGKFSGVASVYGARDLGGDVVDRGAFAKTIAENPVVPILWQHQQDQVIGSGRVTSTKHGLSLDGELDIDIDPLASMAHKKLKRGRIKGLSIGYEPIKAEPKNDVRHLQEVKLWEVSIVTFPMLPSAQVTSVKSDEYFEDLLERFAAEFAEMKAAIAGNPAAQTKFMSLLAEAGLVPTSRQNEPTQPDFGPLVKLLKNRKEFQWN